MDETPNPLYGMFWIASLGKHTLNVPGNHYLENVEIPSSSVVPSGRIRERVVQHSRSGALGITTLECLPCKEECPESRSSSPWNPGHARRERLQIVAGPVTTF